MSLVPQQLRSVCASGFSGTSSAQAISSTLVHSCSQRRWLSSRRSGARLKPAKEDVPDFADVRTPTSEQLSEFFEGAEDKTKNIIDEAIGVLPARHAPTEHVHCLDPFAISPQKLNDLARLIRRRPIDNAILQMQFSPKKASTKIKAMLEEARDEAMFKGLNRDTMIVEQAWVTKGQSWKELDIRGRGKTGIIKHPSAKLSVILRHGQSQEEIKRGKIQKMVKKALRSGAGPVKLNNPIINGGLGRNMYGW